jgi:hypothetical protein
MKKCGQASKLVNSVLHFGKVWSQIALNFSDNFDLSWTLLHDLFRVMICGSETRCLFPFFPPLVAFSSTVSEFLE